jgi:hypothetical protein
MDASVGDIDPVAGAQAGQQVVQPDEVGDRSMLTST